MSSAASLSRPTKLCLVLIELSYLSVRLPEIERSIGVPPPPLLSVHPLHPLFEAAKLLQKTHARRLPLIDRDEQSGGEVVLSVLTQYRVLKFIAVNVSSTPLSLPPRTPSLAMRWARLGRLLTR